jgi:hypothetical protein
VLTVACIEFGIDLPGPHRSKRKVLHSWRVRHWIRERGRWPHTAERGWSVLCQLWTLGRDEPDLLASILDVIEEDKPPSLEWPALIRAARYTNKNDPDRCARFLVKCINHHRTKHQPGMAWGPIADALRMVTEQVDALANETTAPVERG